MENGNIKLKLNLQSLSSLWTEFCQKHAELYELTCDEYMHLLSSDIQELDQTISDKTQLIGYINALESRRKNLLLELVDQLGIQSPPKIGALIEVLNSQGEKVVAKEIERTNLLLLDIIDKIQDQNKSNQIFLNKAIHSLQDLRASFNGKKSFKTYSSNGTTKSNSAL